ncbi:hypothetical protein QZH41_003428 [Actinostola sp. cb2023]|nr:hypothetical protein QZH41_003428 [Actinostola sp. cb2023]
MAQKVRHFFLLFLVVLSSIFSWPSFGQDQRTVYNNFIVVSPSDGNDSKTCLNGTRLAHVPCKTLDYVFEWISNEQHGNSTKVILEPGAYNLTKNATFQGVFDLGISGNGSNLDVEVFCFPDIGLTFIRSGNIQLQNVTISGCGALHHSTIGSACPFERQHKSHAMFYSGVFLAYCKEITIQNCRISHSPGIGLILYDVGGKVHISKSQFVQNAPTMKISYAKKHNYGLAGGGVYMEFTFDGALPPFDANDPERFAYQRDNHYLFEDCTFEGNQAPKQYFEGTLIEFPEGTDHMPFGRGGGLSVFVKGNATNNTVTVQGCQFSNNKALWGAGLFVEFQDKTEDNHLNIWNSHFTNNTANNGGGGVRSGILIWKGHFVANTITHRYNTYEGNEAIFGGGVSHYGPPYSPVKDEHHIRELRFEGCTWKDNRATLGAALGLSTGLLDAPLKNLKLNPTFHYKVILENATISGSRIIRTEDKKVIGQGAVYSCGIPIEFQGNTLFENNSDTALVLDNALMKVYDSLTFTNNTGLLGGAVGVYGLSIIDLMPRSRLHFTYNHATEKGGAIYVAANGPPVLAFETTEFDIRNCFIGYNGSDSVEFVDNWKVKIVFDSNTAKKGGGNSIFVHSLQSCRKPGQNRTNNETMQWHFIIYRSAQGGNVSIGDEISTDPLQIVTHPEEWNVAPGFASAVAFAVSTSIMITQRMRFAI